MRVMHRKTYPTAGAPRLKCASGRGARDREAHRARFKVLLEEGKALVEEFVKACGILLLEGTEVETVLEQAELVHEAIEDAGDAGEAGLDHHRQALQLPVNRKPSGSVSVALQRSRSFPSPSPSSSPR